MKPAAFLGSPDLGKLMSPSEVAQLFNVDPKTVTRWARAGLLPVVRTPGGHRRYREEFVRSLLRERYEDQPLTGEDVEQDLKHI